MKISKEIQADLRAYGHKLHVAQRGVFFKFADAPKWKKRLTKNFIPWNRFFSEDESFTAQNLIDFVCGLGEKIEEKKQEIAKSPVKQAWYDLERLLILPQIIFVYLPLFADIVRAKLTWGENHEIESFFYAAMLGSLLDSAKPQE